MTTEQAETVFEEPQVAEVAEVADVPETPEVVPDYQKLYKEAQAAAERADQRARSIEGSVRSQRERDADIKAALQESRRARQLSELVAENLSNPDSDVDEIKRQLAAIAGEDERTSFISFTAEMAEDMNKVITESGISTDDPKVAEAAALWNDGKDDPKKMSMLVRAQRLVNQTALEKARSEQEIAIKQARDEAREEGLAEGKTRAQRSADTDLGIPRASGSRASDEEVWRGFGRHTPGITRQQAEEAGRRLGYSV